MNRFKNPILRQQFDVMVQKFLSKHSDLYTSEGQPHMGSGGGGMFWLGFADNTPGSGFITRYERSTPAYACWRAGQYCRKKHKDHHINSV